MMMSRQVRRQLERTKEKLFRYASTGFDVRKVRRQHFTTPPKLGSRHNGGYTPAELHQRAMDRLNAAKFALLTPESRVLFQPVNLRQWV